MFRGPTARQIDFEIVQAKTYCIKTIGRAVGPLRFDVNQNPARLAGLGKPLDLWSEIPRLYDSGDASWADVH